MRMKTRKNIMSLIMAVIIILCNITTVLADTNEKVFAPTHGVLSKGNLYYAFGNDGGGSLYRCDVSTKKKTCLVNGECKYISVKGSYVYYTYDSYSGSDFTNYYIYSIHKNGSKKKKLANGYCPVIVGDYVYYIGTKKGKSPYGSDTIDAKTLGVYRMKLDGSKKKRIYSSSEIAQLLSGSNKVYFEAGWRGNTWKYVDTQTGKIYAANIQRCNANTSFCGDTWFRGNNCSISDGKCSYTYSNGYIYKKSETGIKKLAALGGKIGKLICTGDYLIAVTEKKNAAYAYAVRNDGKNKILLNKWIVAGGGWYY